MEEEQGENRRGESERQRGRPPAARRQHPSPAAGSCSAHTVAEGGGEAGTAARGGPRARRRAEGLEEGRGGQAGEGAQQGTGDGREGGRAHLRHQPADDENDEDVEHRMRDCGWSRNLHVEVRRRTRSASGVGRARLLAVERDLAEARRRRAVDQWNSGGRTWSPLKEVN